MVCVIVRRVQYHGCSARLFKRPRHRWEDNIKVDLKNKEDNRVWSVFV